MFKDETGNKYGDWTVLKRDMERTDRNKFVYWICKCKCGKTKSIYGPNLRRGFSKNCGCNRIKDEIGNKYGRLTVVGQSKINRLSWICRCECGNIVSVSGNALRTKNTRSCGCLSPFYNETGKRYGKLIVVKRVENKVVKVNGVTKSGVTRWLCKCDCGKEKIVTGTCLRTGSTKSCGCAHTFEKGKSSFNVMYGGMKKSARVRGYSWELSKEFVAEITSKPCHYCGALPSQCASKKNKGLNGEYIYNGIDRVDNSIGYIPSNVVPCCGVCNVFKRTLSIDEFREKIVSIYNHWANH